MKTGDILTTSEVLKMAEGRIMGEINIFPLSIITADDFEGDDNWRVVVNYGNEVQFVECSSEHPAIIIINGIKGHSDGIDWIGGVQKVSSSEKEEFIGMFAA